ncbi:MAG: hypothetical protein SGI83_14095 [Bacteroidota bacterium]|nr:hypothetical protein [Bacteroidota bacterium]
MRKAFLFTTSILLSVYGFVSCSKDGGGGGGGGGTTVDCNTVTNRAFATDINPIIQNSCSLAGCHAAGSGNGPGALTNYNQVFNARTTIRSAVSSGRMPQGSSLSANQKNSILCWIDGGAPNN